MNTIMQTSLTLSSTLSVHFHEEFRPVIHAQLYNFTFFHQNTVDSSWIPLSCAYLRTEILQPELFRTCQHVIRRNMWMKDLFCHQKDHSNWLAHQQLILHQIIIFLHQMLSIGFWIPKHHSDTPHLSQTSTCQRSLENVSVFTLFLV